MKDREIRAVESFEAVEKIREARALEALDEINAGALWVGSGVEWVDFRTDLETGCVLGVFTRPWGGYRCLIRLTPQEIWSYRRVRVLFSRHFQIPLVFPPLPRGVTREHIWEHFVELMYCVEGSRGGTPASWTWDGRKKIAFFFDEHKKAGAV